MTKGSFAVPLKNPITNAMADDIDKGIDNLMYVTPKSLAASKRGRVITSGTEEPSGGSDGDIYLQYE